jgi:hypothetical protein
MIPNPDLHPGDMQRIQTQIMQTLDHIGVRAMKTQALIVQDEEETGSNRRRDLTSGTFY